MISYTTTPLPCIHLQSQYPSHSRDTSRIWAPTGVKQLLVRLSELLGHSFLFLELIPQTDGDKLGNIRHKFSSEIA